ncbi:MAG: S-methyl-5'-thioadenosine phosphorylase [Candidatus Omnitrophica bacterium CG11_big_fil_rev_8_21_14_0_20_42_13]|uniref:S-methyl-5'-thioadenosine phosphorylase n=1 Tax=Candidatus Ghiorseimicrobium undicola TaxID=1974746 RepID=A0A2H0LV37_9BACT|nr:MAG: S-methyl-5'-thioadenosine phosphorylase [Candidatus Omnitrophica bacterium CG11_big_fil_rev_8_21_14_0_20_42_13]
MSKIGIIGGSGLYNIEGIKHLKLVRVKTPFGEPSDEYITGELEGKEVVFLPRHGREHRISPSKINYRANIFGMKKLGVERIISVSACGSLREEIAPLDFVLPDQFVDRTNQARVMTFFNEGIVAHIGFADPVCGSLSKSIYSVTGEINVKTHLGGTYLNMEGPAFSTRAESNLYRSWGMSIIGMTNISEARLAREAEMCYATLAAVTDYDCWYAGHESVTVEMVIENLSKNVENAKKIIRTAIAKLPEASGCKCASALKYAIVTQKQAIPEKVKKELGIIIGKYVN